VVAVVILPVLVTSNTHNNTNNAFTDTNTATTTTISPTHYYSYVLRTTHVLLTTTRCHH